MLIPALCLPLYYNQVDICGHFNAYPNTNKEPPSKYGMLFFAVVTGAVDCHLMEDYSADSFALAFTRFVCRFGYLKRLLPDEGR